MAQQSSTPTKPPAVVSSTPLCTVEERDGAALVHFRIQPEVWKRHLTRIPAKVEKAEYIYRIVRAAVEGAVF